MSLFTSEEKLQKAASKVGVSFPDLGFGRGYIKNHQKWIIIFVM